MAKQGPNLLNPRLAKALEHPIRMDILGILQGGPSSPARIERQLENVSLNLVSHHMKVLKELGCVELVETVNKRGAREHVYRAVELPVLSDKEWDELSPKLRQRILMEILRKISNDLARSLGAGVFDETTNTHLSRSPLKLDGQGWSEIVDLLTGTLGEVLEIGAKSSKRVEASDETPMPVTVAIMQFPTPE